MAGTAISKLTENYIRGGREERWKFTLDPASIAAAAQGIETVAIPGARAGDPVVCSPEAPEANLLIAGAKVTADDVVSLYLDNNITVTTALDGGALVWYLYITKRTVAAA